MARLRIGHAATNQISRNQDMLVNPSAEPWASAPTFDMQGRIVLDFPIRRDVGDNALTVVRAAT
jgi:hypothetical protein